MGLTKAREKYLPKFNITYDIAYDSNLYVLFYYMYRIMYFKISYLVLM